MVEADACHPLQVWMLWCTLIVRRKVVETMPMAQNTLACQVAESGLLGVHRKESMADSTAIHRDIPGQTVCFMGDIDFPQIKGVYVLHGAPQS